MTFRVIILLTVITIVLCECKEAKQTRHYSYFGKATFRRLYNVDDREWSEAEIDSLTKTNPKFVHATPNSENKSLDILIALGIADENELLLNKITSYLKDTITIYEHGASIDTAYIKYDTATNSARIQIKNKKINDSIAIDDYPSFLPPFSLIELKDHSKPYILFVNQYHIANGDTYEIFIYKKE